MRKVFLSELAIGLQGLPPVSWTGELDEGGMGRVRLREENHGDLLFELVAKVRRMMVIR